MSIEGGMSGVQKRFVCPHCGKVFFAWRPDTAPGVKIKCYFCKKEVEDEASQRTPPPSPPQPADAAPAAAAAPAPAPAPSPPGVPPEGKEPAPS